MNLLALIFRDIIDYLKGLKLRASYIKKFPTSRVYRGAQVLSSQLEGNNVVFRFTTIINSEVGKHSYIQQRSQVCNVKIGKFCSIASNVTIGPGVHKMDSISTHPSFYLKNTPLVRTFVNEDKFTPFKETIIGHDVWIGQNAVIMDGVNVGTGAVIASGAVVTKNVEPFAIMGGVPAKCIKYRFDKETASKILKDEWWLKSDEELEQNVDSLLNVSSNDTNC